MNRFGRTLKLIREGKGKSLAEVAKGHISTSQLSRFENGESDITVSKLFGVLAEMNVDVDEFVYASQDFKKDELTRILEQLKQSIYTRDVVTIKKILSEQLAKAERDSRREFHRLNAILIAYKLSDLDKTVVVSKEDTAFLTDYLFQVDNWSYYELLLFANTMDELEHQTMMLFCRELIGRTQFYREMKLHRLAVSQILLSAYLVSVQHKELADAIFLEKTIKGLFFDETEIFERILFKFGKAFYDYRKTGSANAILEMRKCIELLRAVDSQNIADWYETILEKIVNEK
ncbi:TPA: helix-turn-helix domain-containing protein [Streptococcus suis]|uniref:Helix-turn-helix domain-containing protein n=1 Tax=Streptococcus suis TaxID=1307 RepID=A0A123TAQ9_STRSU|nr:Rgg/GadR/MutR family transcriptional regulator [Streptococcus suis]MCQ8271838.1 helix-turn-helix domain-containing protein [Streptococcus suis]MCQ8784920.1 helix-turn-helix domain-containing protein [Streptococcus suis]MDW8721164.1 helix-turn-helix domain-containing protein [Streptococcus suis]MDY7596838.1 helix-turn-helix domain-containing protein [Streptococcus suis]MDY7600842.1 helix-turn-helix domain-containing protein [Streptococcus suis]